MPLSGRKKRTPRKKQKRCLSIAEEIAEHKTESDRMAREGQAAKQAAERRSAQLSTEKHEDCRMDLVLEKQEQKMEATKAKKVAKKRLLARSIPDEQD
jgi:hypothetical protein